MNSFGRIFRISIFGESHGPALGVIIDGCPAGIPVSADDFINDIERRSGGKPGTTPRKEKDIPEIVSGLFNGHTTGSPLTILFRNKDVRPSDYEEIKKTPRPGHSDFVAWKKHHGFNDYRGAGHFSGRLTLTLIAAGVVAKKCLENIKIEAQVVSAGGTSDVDAAVQSALREGDSVGGIVECVTTGLEAGLGEPFFDSAESLIAHLAFAVPAIKGIEFGSGFKAATMKGSEHNDVILDESGKTLTNFSGGISGGITNGNTLVFRVAVKPTSSISKKQLSYSVETGKMEELSIKGRHDACIALRVPVVMAAITAIVLTDLLLIRKTQL